MERSLRAVGMFKFPQAGKSYSGLKLKVGNRRGEYIHHFHCVEGEQVSCLNGFVVAIQL
jgi:hypothetical protein